MRTEAELIAEAKAYQVASIDSLNFWEEKGIRHTSAQEKKYKDKFDTVAWVLQRDSWDLWMELLEQKKVQETPLFSRLSRLTNPTPSGTILEPKE